MLACKPKYLACGLPCRPRCRTNCTTVPAMLAVLPNQLLTQLPTKQGHGPQTILQTLTCKVHVMIYIIAWHRMQVIRHRSKCAARKSSEKRAKNEAKTLRAVTLHGARKHSTCTERESVNDVRATGSMWSPRLARMGAKRWPLVRRRPRRPQMRHANSTQNIVASQTCHSNLRIA